MGVFFARSTRLELATSRVTGGCSNQLSYDRTVIYIAPSLCVLRTVPAYQKTHDTSNDTAV